MKKTIAIGALVLASLAGCAVPAATDSATSSASAKSAKKNGNITDEGTLSVGTDVKPGTYKATVPADSLGCYWARLKGTSGQLEDIAANDNVNAKGKALVTITNKDKAFETHGCGEWVKQK